MERVRPILFSTEMVRAVLDGRKTETRRLIMPHNRKKAKEQGYRQGDGLWIDPGTDNGDKEGHIKDYSVSPCWTSFSWYIDKLAPYRPGDILYVRETWNYGYIETSDCLGSFDAWFEQLNPDDEHDLYIEALSGYFYKADEDAPGSNIGMVWRPSIHMPEKAARIWIKVADVRAERLQEITIDGCRKEGCWCGHNGDIFAFMALWDSTIKKADADRYGWNADPWVWVIEFERCGKPAEA